MRFKATNDDIDCPTWSSLDFRLGMCRRRRGRATAIACVTICLSLLFPAPGIAAAHPYHKSLTYTNNGCKWYGVHEVASTVGGEFAAGAGTYRVAGCVEVHVRLKVDNKPILEDYDYSLASVAINPMNTFKYSDHNANPSGAPPYVGFRFST